MEAPLPPFELIERVGAVDDPAGRYVEIGRHQLEVLEHYLGDDWDWKDRTLLDWGCGAGRLLRLMVDTPARLIGVEIDRASIDWMRDHLPRVEGVLVDRPVLPLGDATVDVVTGLSVLTHIADDWAEWLLEIRRVLRPGGIAILTFIGGLTAPLLSDQWDEDAVGMLVLRYANPWTYGGPDVIHAPWWIREHWGRAFQVRSIEPDPLLRGPGQHEFAVLTRPDTPPPTVADLVQLADDPREALGLSAALYRTRYELAMLQIDRSRLETLDQENRALRDTLSWRITSPLRALRRAMKGRST